MIIERVSYFGEQQPYVRPALAGSSSLAYLDSDGQAYTEPIRVKFEAGAYSCVRTCGHVTSLDPKGFSGAPTRLETTCCTVQA